jgi:hypothetical protein
MRATSEFTPVAAPLPPCSRRAQLEAEKEAMAQELRALRMEKAADIAKKREQDQAAMWVSCTHGRQNVP